MLSLTFLDLSSPIVTHTHTKSEVFVPKDKGNIFRNQVNNHYYPSKLVTTGMPVTLSFQVGHATASMVVLCHRNHDEGWKNNIRYPTFRVQCPTIPSEIFLYAQGYDSDTGSSLYFQLLKLSARPEFLSQGIIGNLSIYQECLLLELWRQEWEIQ